MEFLESCRICAKVQKWEETNNIFQTTLTINSNFAEKELSEVYSYVTNLAINREDGLSCFICNECSGKCCDAYEFKCRAERTYNMMIQLLHAKGNDAPNNNISNAVKDETSKNSNNEQQISKSFKSTKEASKERVQPTLESTNEMVAHKEDEETNDSCDDVSIIDIDDIDFIPDENCSESDKDECAVKYLTRQSKTSKMNEKSTKLFKNVHVINRKSSINEQRSTTHTCQVCGRDFPRKSNLIDHLRLHAKVKLFQCNLCEKSFVQVANYRTHMRTHTNERPYECHLCSKAYSQSSALKIHIRSHTDERNYHCPECKKGFTNASDLNKHKRVHDPNKQFKCEICFRLFAQKVNMLSHQRRMHKDDV